MPLDDVRRVADWDAARLRDSDLPGISRLIAAGETLRAIGKRYGVSHTTVKNFCRKHGLSIDKKRGSWVKPGGPGKANPAVQDRIRRTFEIIRDHPGISLNQLHMMYGRTAHEHHVRYDVGRLIGQGLVVNLGGGRFAAAQKQSAPDRSGADRQLEPA